jgi:hypothetical protein
MPAIGAGDVSLFEQESIMSAAVTTWEAFQQRWDGIHNFLMEGDAFGIDYTLPPLERIIDEMRFDPDARITANSGGGRRNPTDISAHVRAMPLERLLEEPFSMGHFKLANFDHPGGLLEGLEQKVLARWRSLLSSHGFAWSRVGAYIFISGKGAASSYHMDFSHVLAWQQYGTKRFCSFKEPYRWAPEAMRRKFFDGHKNYHEWFEPPADKKPEDVLELVMPPGAMLWNAFMTPHWVLGEDDAVTLSINISHGGLHLKEGPLCPHEVQLEKWRAEVAPA